MTQSPETPPPPVQLVQMITGHWVAAAIYSAVKLRLPDHLAGGALNSEALARAAGTHADSTYRLCRALSALGVLIESPGQKFELSPLGDLLRSDHPQSMRSMAMFQGAPPHWQGWGSFAHAVETGQPAFEHVHGKQFFDYCAGDPEFAAAFNGAMTALSAAASAAVVQAYDFSGIRTLVDVGGGHGHLLSTILSANSQLQGIVFDLPQVVEGATPAIAAAGLQDRCQAVGGSFFDSVPAGDAYISKHIIHDWDDEHSRKILSNMAAAMDGHGKVLLVEVVIGFGNESLFAKLIDLEMLHATHGGRERTEDEFRALFASAGLKLQRVVPTQSMFCVLEAVPA